MFAHFKFCFFDIILHVHAWAPRRTTVYNANVSLVKLGDADSVRTISGISMKLCCSGSFQFVAKMTFWHFVIYWKARRVIMKAWLLRIAITGSQACYAVIRFSLVWHKNWASSNSEACFTICLVISFSLPVAEQIGSGMIDSCTSTSLVRVKRVWTTRWTWEDAKMLYVTHELTWA